MRMLRYFSISKEHRLNVWNKVKDLEQIVFDKEKMIRIEFTDSSFLDLNAGTTPLAITRMMAGDFVNRAMACKVNGKIVDLTTPLIENAKIELLDFDDADGRKAYWRTAAFMLGYALEEKFGQDLILYKEEVRKNGFSSSCYISDNPHHSWLEHSSDVLSFLSNEKKLNLTIDDFPALEQLLKNANRSRKLIHRKVISNQDAQYLFRYNPLKLHLLSSLPEKVQIYKFDKHIDLIKGPLVDNTWKCKANALIDTSTVHFSQETKPLISTVTGISFPKRETLARWKTEQEEIKLNDHRNLGVQQELFMLHPHSPGSPFILPNGMRILSKLQSVMRAKYHQYGFEQVDTPIIFKSDLWKISGHWQHYKENMFLLQDDEEIGMKPMNCPAHCLIYKSKNRSHRDLPLRLFDFGPLHRNEATGALGGLTRVRKFQIDDGHIFCKPDDIRQEITSTLLFIDEIYKMFGLKYGLSLSTRPDSYIGDIQDWFKAETMLKQALEGTGQNWDIKHGDGAFYGPKIDISVYDAHKRKHQTATVQLDFQLPMRFDLEYHGSDEKRHMPVVIHRAILGSFERMFAILIEHYRGRWPFWLSPRQALICTLSDDPNIVEYAKSVQKTLSFDEKCKGIYHVDMDLSGSTIAKKVRDGALKHYNYILVVGETEADLGQVAVRTTKQDLGKMSLEHVLYMFKRLDQTFQ